MSDIYTRGGDKGETSLRGGARVSKDDARIEAFGDLDEANCAIGLARPSLIDSDIEDLLEFMQQRLYNCSALLADPTPMPGTPTIEAEDVALLEHAIDRYSERVGDLKGFILPGCDESAARLHLARATMRRAERSVVRVAHDMDVSADVLAFLNRASDFLFIAARYAGSGNECLWDPNALRPRAAEAMRAGDAAVSDGIGPPNQTPPPPIGGPPPLIGGDLHQKPNKALAPDLDR